MVPRMTAYTDDATLPDLRPTIAEIFDGLSTSALLNRGGAALADAYRLRSGAETLRWSAERDAWTTEELEGQISHLVNIIEEIEEILDRPSGKIKEIREVVAKTWA